MAFRIISEGGAPAPPSSRFHIVKEGEGKVVSSSRLGSFGRGLAAGLIPALGGAGGVGTALTLGAPLIAASGPFAPVTSAALAVGGGLLGAGAGSVAQEGALRLAPDPLESRIRSQLSADVSQHPLASLAGQLAASGPFYKPSLKNIGQAAGAVRNLATRTPLSTAQVAQLTNVAGGGAISAGVEAGGQFVRREPFDPAKVGVAFGAGAAFNEPTRLGKRLGLPPTTPRTFEVGSSDPKTGRLVLQPSDDVRTLITGAAKEQPEFARFLQRVSETVPGSRVANVRVKSLAKTSKKIFSGRSAQSVSDYLGGRIIVDTVEEIPTLVRAIEDSGQGIPPSENMFVLDKLGYRGYHAQVKLPNGMTAEVQLHVPEIAEVLDRVHTVYDRYKAKTIPFDQYALEAKQILDEAWGKYLARTGGTKALDVPSGVGLEAIATPETVTQTAMSRTLAEGGVTISDKGLSPTTGYVLSPYKAREFRVSKRLLTEEMLTRYRTSNQDLLSAENHFLGVWDTGNVVYLDVSVAHPEEGAALALAEQHHQEAIWDVARKTELFTEFGKSRRAAKEAGRPLPLRPLEGNLGAVHQPGQPGAPPAAAPGRPIGGESPPGDVGVTTPRLGVPVTEDITRAAQRLIERNPSDPVSLEHVPRLFQRISTAMRQGRIAAEDIPALKDAGLTTLEAADLFEQAATFSGQTLNRLSQVARQINQVAPELAKELDAQSKVPPTVWTKLANAPRRVVNLWRASLVSQLATAVRNFAVFHQRYAFRLIEDSVNGAYETATKTRIPREAFGPLLEDLVAYGRSLKPGNRQRVLTTLAQIDPLLKEKLWQTPISDVTVTGRYAKLLGTFNNAQEYFARTIIADSVLAGEVRRGGQLGVQTARMAVDRALDMTFAKYPRSRFGREFIKAWNNPVLNVLTYPFPRYLTNAVRAIWEYSPAGAMRLIHPRYQAILRSGDPRMAVEVATKAALGSAMFAAASWIRNSEHAGEKWYEVQMGGKTIDVRPFGPLLPVYLFAAEAIKTGGAGFEPRDWAEGLLGINRMAGTTLFMTSVLAGKNPDTIKRKLAEFSGQFAGGFTVPLRTFQNFVAQFSKEEATIRDVKQAPLSGPVRANIPGVSRRLPPRFFSTRPGVTQREHPGVRQFTGLTARTKNEIEHELDRLGISSFEVEPRTGNRVFDQQITRRLGELAAQQIPPLIRSARYQAMSDEEQRDALKGRYATLRKMATNTVSQNSTQLREHLRARRETQRAIRERRNAGNRLAPILQPSIPSGSRFRIISE